MVEPRDTSNIEPRDTSNIEPRDTSNIEPRDTIKIENVVASTGIGIEINLKQITLALEGADYDPEQFPGLVYRTRTRRRQR